MICKKITYLKRKAGQKVAKNLQERILFLVVNCTVYMSLEKKLGKILQEGIIIIIYFFFCSLEYTQDH